ncbi:hypothetical protein [Pseudaeromonas paramecii]|uniref:hypothetical protein n=1 Tax=Pseudaeromonas paramecii TaxID=2138166 RepID=UPI0031E67892
MKLSRFDHNPFLFQAYGFAVVSLVCAGLLLALVFQGSPLDLLGLFDSLIAMFFGWYLDSELWGRHYAALDQYLTLRAIERRRQQ